MRNTGNQATPDILDLNTWNVLYSVSIEYKQLTNSLYSWDTGRR